MSITNFSATCDASLECVPGGDCILTVSCVDSLGRQLTKQVGLAPYLEMAASLVRDHSRRLRGRGQSVGVGGIGDFFRSIVTTARTVAQNKAVKDLYNDAEPALVATNPEIAAAVKIADVIAHAKDGQKKALETVKAVKARANAGDPTAKQAVVKMLAISKAQDIVDSKQSLYSKGITTVGHDWTNIGADPRRPGFGQSSRGSSVTVTNSAIPRGTPNPARKPSITFTTPGGAVVHTHQQVPGYKPGMTNDEFYKASQLRGANARAFGAQVDANALAIKDAVNRNAALGTQAFRDSTARDQTYWTVDPATGIKVDQSGNPYIPPGGMSDGQGGYVNEYGQPIDEQGNPLPQDLGYDPYADPYGGMGFDPYGGLQGYNPYQQGYSPYGGIQPGPYGGFDPYGGYGYGYGPSGEVIQAPRTQVYDEATGRFYSNDVKQVYDPDTNTFAPVQEWNPYADVMDTAIGGWLYNHPFRGTVEAIFASDKSPGVGLAARELYNRGLGRGKADARKSVISKVVSEIRKHF